METSARVTVSEGILEGEVVENEYGAPFYSFKGIPYAEPPVGHLRFKAPQPPTPWTGVRKANEFGSSCYQAGWFGRPNTGSEDCLYLNVYTPSIKPDKPLPVMFWIHGGAFKAGNGNDDTYGPEFLVRHGVILVTFNYRLEVLGFLCLDTEDVPGNAGMKDQVAALRWVHKNIQHFGGDPNNVTIFGNSAGSVSVSYHLVSPMSKGLFKKAIAQSGASTCWIGLVSHPRERALALAKKLGLKSENNKELYEFFKSLPVEKLVNAQTSVRTAETLRIPEEISFLVSSEKKFDGEETFFHGDPYSVLRNGIHKGVDVITGYTADEGIFAVGTSPDLEKVYELANSLADYVVPKPIAENCSSIAQIQAGKKILKFYFEDDEVSKVKIDALIKYYSMYYFSYGTYQWAKICSSLKRNKIYLYKFTCLTERNIMSKMLGAAEFIGSRPVVCHGDDVCYIFPTKIMNKVDKDSETFKIIDRVTKLWTNMAKYGNPTPDSSLGVTWKPFDPKHQNYLDIGIPLTEKTFPDKEELAFWEDIFRTYAPHYVYK